MGQDKVDKEQSTVQTTYTHNVRIDHVIFDNDGTLYPEPPDVKQRHMQAAVRAVHPRYPDKSPADIETLIRQSQKDYKSSFGMFVADILGSEEREAELLRLRALHYEELSRLAVKDFFDQSAAPTAEIGQLRIAGINVNIATHGNLLWTKFSVRENGGLSRYFNDTNIFTKDDANCKGKNEGDLFYQKLMDKMNLPQAQKRGQNCAMVEDTAKNLIEAKRLGMMTILISDTLNSDEKPDYVDLVVPDVKQAIQAIMQSNLSHGAAPNPNAQMHQERTPTANVAAPYDPL